LAFRCCQDGAPVWPGATEPPLIVDATTQPPATNPPTEKPATFVEKTSKSDVCRTGFDEYVLATKELCDEAVAALASGAAVSYVPASSSTSSWPKGCFHRGDGAYFFNQDGTTGTPTRDSFRICGFGDAPATALPPVGPDPAPTNAPTVAATNAPQPPAPPSGGGEVSKYACAQLRGSSLSATLSSVCGVSKIGPSKTCYNTGTHSWSEAKAVCSAAGLRLCTLEEVQHDILSRSGCSSGKRRYVWTNDACDGGHMVSPITIRHEKRIPTQCGADHGEFAKVSIRCCADADTTSAPPALTNVPPAVTAVETTVKPNTSGGGGSSSSATCSCTAISSPVCGDDGVTYANPCNAFCAGSYSFYPGGCSAMREDTESGEETSLGYCPADAFGMFTMRLDARLKNSNLRTLWDNRQSDDPAIANRKYTPEECAHMCVHFNTDERGIYGTSCHAFEHHTKQGRCELKAADASEIPALPNTKWTLHIRTGYCDSDAQGRDSSTYSHGASKRPYK